MESQSISINEANQQLFDDSPIALDQLDPSTSNLPSTLRRRTFSRGRISSKEPEDSLPEASTIEDHSKTNSGEPRPHLYRDLDPNEQTSEITDLLRDGFNSTRVIEEKSEDGSADTTARNHELVDRYPSSADSGTELSESLHSSSSLLLFIASLVINAIGFQLNLLICFIALPLSVLGCGDMVNVDLFKPLMHGRSNIITKVLNLRNSICGYFSPVMNEWLNLKDHKSVWNIVLRLGWGMLWAIYVGCVLCGLLFTSILISGILMRYLVVESLEIKEILNFDYTNTSPVAFVPIVSCAAVACGAKCTEKIDIGKNVGSRVIPLDHELQVAISLTLPDSNYNRNLGMFQVRVDFVSVTGETVASSSHPCMLKFKSEPVRYLLTFFKLAPLLTGYSLETQTLNLKIRDLKEGIVPTACLRVVLEQRAEHRAGAGIPELYNAILILESQLPFMKRMIRYWRRSIFVWMSMTWFTMELLSTLVCCRPILIPRTRTSDGSQSSWQAHV